MTIWRTQSASWTSNHHLSGCGSGPELACILDDQWHSRVDSSLRVDSSPVSVDNRRQSAWVKSLAIHALFEELYCMSSQEETSPRRRVPECTRGVATELILEKVNGAPLLDLGISSPALRLAPKSVRRSRTPSRGPVCCRHIGGPGKHDKVIRITIRILSCKTQTDVTVQCRQSTNSFLPENQKRYRSVKV